MVVTTKRSAQIVQRYDGEGGGGEEGRGGVGVTASGPPTVPADTSRREHGRTGRNRGDRALPKSCGHDRDASARQILWRAARAERRRDRRRPRPMDAASHETAALR